MTERTHTHPCATCGVKTECPGTYERNYDGWPEVACTVYHMRDEADPPFLCDDCQRTYWIAELNDLCRTAMGVAGRLFQTPGITALAPSVQSAIREAVEQFDAFTPGNDPHGERDFGAFEHDGARVFWKIDYFDPSLEGGSEDPSDPAQTVRVLTIMLASEY